MKKLLLMACVTFIIISSPTTYAQTNQAPDQLMENGVKMILDAMKLFIQNLPQYEAPQLLDNGDIIIKRKQPKKNEKGIKPGPQTRI